MRDSRNSAAFSPGGHAGQLRRVAAAAKPLSSRNHATLFTPVPFPRSRRFRRTRNSTPCTGPRKRPHQEARQISPIRRNPRPSAARRAATLLGGAKGAGTFSGGSGTTPFRPAAPAERPFFPRLQLDAPWRNRTMMPWEPQWESDARDFGIWGAAASTINRNQTVAPAWGENGESPGIPGVPRLCQPCAKGCRGNYCDCRARLTQPWHTDPIMMLQSHRNP
jgi:hypothetical protein